MHSPNLVQPGIKIVRRFLALTALSLGAWLAFAGIAKADFGITEFDGAVSGPSGEAFTQAGGHPSSASTYFRMNSSLNPVLGGTEPDGTLRRTDVELPPGFVGNPTVASECQFEELIRKQCPANSQVGTMRINTSVTPVLFESVYNMTPQPGQPASFGFNIGGVAPVIMSAKVRTGEDYGLTVVVPGIAQTLPINAIEAKFWGVPASAANDPERPEYSPAEDVTLPERPFLTNPTSCTAPGTGLLTRLDASGWEGGFDSATFESHLPPGSTLADPLPPSEWGPPSGATGCPDVPFEVEAEIAPTSTAAASPTGMEVTLAMPQEGLENPDRLATAHLKEAEVVLPEGMTLNSSSAGGLGACAPGEIKLNSSDPAVCPESSKIGTVSIDTPLLEETVDGGVYLAKQGDNPFNSLLAIYLIAKNEERGIEIKLAGKVAPDPSTGRLVTTFEDNPQLPFNAMRLRFKSGERAPLINPPACGTYTTTAKFSPWSAEDPDNPRPAETVTVNDSFQVTSGPNGAPCPNGAVAPKLEAGLVSPVGGESSPFVVRLSREDGTGVFTGIEAKAPEGVSGRLKGVPYCSEAAISTLASRTGAGQGALELGSPACPAASRVGSLSAGAGAGSNPFYVSTGRVDLAGPYKGAPLSLVASIPATAGPFDLGTVTNRIALHVDPTTAQVKAISDPLPTILHGIPLNIRDIRVALDKPGFAQSPTSCDPQSIKGTVRGPGGASADVNAPFRLRACDALAFKPKLAMRFSGAPPRRGGFPRLTATVTMPEGGANIRKAVVTMPKTQFLENAHIRTICTRVQWAAESCPKASVYGYAKAWTPLLDQPLQGPVYLRSSSNKLPDLVADLDGQIEIELAGRIDSVRERIRNTFVTVPDAPVSKFQLTMRGGRKGLLVNNTNICKTKPVANADFDGQNGKVADSKIRVKVTGCGKGKRR